MNRITKYNNKLNSVPMRLWSADEQDFFFAIITEARDKGKKRLTFTEDQLKGLANYSDRHNQRFMKTINSLVKKLDGMRYYESTENSYKVMALFQEFDVSWKGNADEPKSLEIKIMISEGFEYIINKLESEFTRFELAQFTNIRSTYAKEAFKRFKQWRTVGRVAYKTEGFKEEFAIPKSYRAKDIDKNVLTPILNELDPYFEHLKLEKKKGKTAGRKIEEYIFTWKPETTQDWDSEKFDKTPPKKSAKRKSKKRVENIDSWKENVEKAKVKNAAVDSEGVQQQIEEKMKQLGIE